MNPAAPVFHPPTSTALWTNIYQAILLQTAQALVFNPDDPQCSKHVHVVLDSGSQRLYVTEQLKTEVTLKSTGAQSMTIMTCRSREESPQVFEVVNVHMELRGGQMKQLTLFVVPLICEPLTCQPIVFCRDNFQRLSGLTLADPSDGQEQLEVDILMTNTGASSLERPDNEKMDPLQFKPSWDGCCQNQLTFLQRTKLGPLL